MKLYDFLKENDADYDTYDLDYDEIVTCCINIEPEDDYDEFCVALCKKIDVVDYTCCGDPICNWSEFIKRNMDVLRDFSNKYWQRGNYEDEDDFICEWMKELHLFMAGYGADDSYGFYKTQIVDKCK